MAPYPTPEDELSLFLEILSCSDLLIGDKTSSDPYVKCKIGDTEFHRTKHLLKTLNPVFGPEHDNACVINVNFGELREADGIALEIKDWDRIGRNDKLGKALVTTDDILKGAGKITLDISPPPDSKEKSAGSITISIRHANASERSKYGAAAGNFWNPETLSERKPAIQPQSDSDAGVTNTELVDKEVLIEILSCRNLIAADSTGLSDPYAKIKLAGKELHKTKCIQKTLNPTFTSEDSNFYILTCPAEELFQKGGIQIQVKDFDRGIGKNDALGSVDISAETLYNTSHSEGESIELALLPPDGQEGTNAGYITLRLRPPTYGDKEDLKAKTSLRGKLKSKLVPKKKEPEERDNAVAQRMSLIDKEDKILLIEILSCRDLLVADKSGSSDPYVKIKFGDKEVHRTKHIRQTLNPVFSDKTKNSFVLDCPVTELFANNGLALIVKDWDRGIGGNDALGEVGIPADVLYEFGPNPREFEISPPAGKSDAAGFITIQCSEISPNERDARTKTGLFAKFVGAPKDTLQRGDIRLNEVSLLVEIVSCQNLIKADMNGSDPYVKAKVGDKDVHKTKHVPNNQDPIYTIKTDSLFILDVEKDEILDEAWALTFIVKDKDTGKRNQELGHVSVSGTELMKANGERMTYNLLPREGSKYEEAGVLNLRCRPASNYDKKFLEYASTGDQSTDFLGFGANTDILMKPRGGSNELIKGKLTVEDSGIKKNRVRPEPDPDRPSATKWLSDAEIQELSLEPSRRWIEVGSGNLGQLYIEILGADGLPNLDSSVRGRDKSDPFVMIVYEDCCAKTDIIDDCLSPRWLPWMQRAFVLNMEHTSSDIFVGAFDYDPSLGGRHDLIGRFTIETSTLQPNTQYVLYYNLFEDSFTKERKAQGSITVRVRLEVNDQREMVLSNLQLPPDEFINVKKKRDFHIVRQTVHGKTDLTSYSLNTALLYVDEITSYMYIQYYITDAVISLLFWRGQVPFCGIKLPLHSLIAFIAAITLAERPALFFPYCWWGNAWLLLAIQSWRNTTPNPWDRCKSFGEILRMIILNSVMTRPDNIPSYHMEREAREFEADMTQRIQKAETLAEKRREEELKILAGHEKEIADLDMAADTDIATKTGGIRLDPLMMVKPYVYPIQQLLCSVCFGIRVLRNIYTWEEPYFAFLFCVASMLVGCIFIVIPWSFLIHWTGRIVAWGLFGPHMKLVDIFYFSKLKESTEEEEKQELEAYYKAQKEIALETAQVARIQTEEAVKLKEIKKILYGNFICRVPVVKGERIRDVPLPKSFAQPYEKAEGVEINPIVIGGQGFVGNMIPKPKAIVDTSEHTVEGSPATETTPLLP